MVFFFFSSRRRHTRCSRDWSSDVCSSDLVQLNVGGGDADDGVVRHVQVHLTPDAAVGANGPDHSIGVADLLGGEALLRHHLEDRTGGTNPDALPAPGTAGLVRVPVGANDDL